MAGDNSGKRNSNNQLLEELEALSQSLYQSHVSNTRRTASLTLPRSSAPPVPSADEADPSRNEDKPSIKPRPRRMSLSPWRPWSKHEPENDQKDPPKTNNQRDLNLFDDAASSNGKKGIWKWKPIRALSHIGMQKLSCLFSVEVVAAQGLPASMNSLRLSVCVRKNETKDGAVHTMPSRVSQGAADFEETLFVKCHVYCSTSGGREQQMKFEPRPFLIYLFAVDAEELDFGKSCVDLSRLIRESMQQNAKGTRIRQWDTSFKLEGKANGGELVLKLGFQIMEKDGGIGLYNQIEGEKSSKGRTFSSLSFARKQSKTSFSIPSPKLSSRAQLWSPSQAGAPSDIQHIDDLNLDEPAPPEVLPDARESKEPVSRTDDLEIPEFEVVDKGVEILDTEEAEEKGLNAIKSEERSRSQSRSPEVVKEIVHDQFHLTRLSELDSIAQQIKALESLMGGENLSKTDEETASQRLDSEEETVTKEFLQMLEDEEASDLDYFHLDLPPKLETNAGFEDSESKVFLPDLGKGLGCVIQTKTGGYLASTNPLEVAMAKKDAPKLAMQISKPFVLTSQNSINGFELFQRMAATGLEELSSEVMSLMSIEELMGKTPEQVAFEGIASAIITGRNKEGASSSAARTIAAVKKMATAMSSSRKERVETGIWNVSEDTQTVVEILAFSMQKIEAMSIDALKIQAEITEEDAPFEVSPSKKDRNHPLSSAVPLEDWIKNDNPEDSASITVALIIQLRDPLRRYEAVGGPRIVLISATSSDKKEEKKYDEHKKFKVASLHIGGMKVRTGQKRNVWDTEKQRLTAMQWLVAYGLGRTPKKGKTINTKENDLLWSISSRIVADMWLKPVRNPNVKFTK